MDEKSASIASAETGKATKNRFDRMEWAGAFGDLGTLIPFVVAYITVVKVDPLGILVSFGAAMVICGFFYKTPFPVQPMKAIGAVAATQAAQTAVITPAALHAAGLVTGAIWLILGLTGLAHVIAKLVARPVVVGIVLGLGMGFMVEGIKMMAGNWLIAAVALLGTLLLLTNRRMPAMFALLLLGAAYGANQSPELLGNLSSVNIEFRLPTWQVSNITWNDLVIGTLFLALPQLPLTLGNAVIAIREENNELFPNRPVTEKTVATSTGLMNLAGGAIGGVPMCHGAGGMAGHIAFGARTGGALVILGVTLLILGLFFSGSVETLFKLFPPVILGVILFLTGAQLALGSCDFGDNKLDRFITLITAAFAMWNVGIAFIVGMLGVYMVRKNLLKL